MKVTIENLDSTAEIAAEMAQFGKPISENAKQYLRERGFNSARSQAISCIKWVWCQWLAGGAVSLIQKRVAETLKRGMELKQLPSQYEWRAVHDLYLLHCAIFASDKAELIALAKRVGDSSGFKGHTPQKNQSEQYAGAWCGLLKHSILGDQKKAVLESEQVWKSPRTGHVHASSKPLVTPWLKKDWHAFMKAQKQDFEQRWAVARKNSCIHSKSDNELVVDISRLTAIEQFGSWSPCGLALLAYRFHGVEVVTDPFWFPPHALKCVDRTS